MLTLTGIGGNPGGVGGDKTPPPPQLRVVPPKNMIKKTMLCIVNNVLYLIV